MITLRVPFRVRGKLGSDDPADDVLYDRLTVAEPLQVYPKANRTEGTLELVSSATPAAPTIRGTLRILGAEAVAVMRDVNFHRTISLTGPQRTALTAKNLDTQDSYETGLLAIDMFDGTHARGSG